MSFPRVLQEVKCPVSKCPVIVHSAGRLREYFMYRHFGSKVAVVQDVAQEDGVMQQKHPYEVGVLGL